MHVVMIGQKGLPAKFGGIETHVADLSRELVKLGVKVTAYARTWYTSSEVTRFDGIDVVRLPTIHTKHLDAGVHTLLATLHALVKIRPDVYHFHGVGPSFFAWLPRIFAPTAKVVCTFHCVDRRHEKWGPFARFMLFVGERATTAFPHVTIAVGKTVQEYIANTHGAASTYLPNGVYPQRATVDHLLVAPFGLEPMNYLMMVSRLIPHKGAHTLIRAWQSARLRQPELLKEQKLVIVGDGMFTDSYVQELKTLASQDDSIVFTGFQRGDTLEGLYMGARFTVHPSTSEGLPIVVLEAMSYGKAVITSDIPEHEEVLPDNSLMFATGDSEALADRILELVADPMKAAAAGHLNRIAVEEDYHWPTIARETAGLYQSLVATKARSLLLAKT
jgi:glycosyltransferase involved in cell wall biosynthesis